MMTVHNRLARQTPDVRAQDRCKVCTKQIRVGEDHVKVFHGGNFYVVCCASCATKFEAHPQQYLMT
jgi:YHS domain-containing protein